MPQVEQVLIFLASPGDVPSERRYVQEVVDEVNRTIAANQGVVLQVVRWETSTFPGYGDDPQAVVNAQVTDMARHALFVGIMWNRLGTPTKRADSGTFELFDRARQALRRKGQPAIWFYFRNAPASLNTADQLAQRGKVLEFKKRIGRNALLGEYRTPQEFREQFRNQLSLWLGA